MLNLCFETSTASRLSADELLVLSSVKSLPTCQKSKDHMSLSVRLMRMTRAARRITMVKFSLWGTNKSMRLYIYISCLKELKVQRVTAVPL